MQTPAQQNPSGKSRALTDWLFAPVALLAIGLGVTTVLRGPGWILGVTLAIVLGGTFLWIFLSVLWPSKADKTCPSCGAEALQRLDSTSTRGVLCQACGHVDESASSFYLAEESDEPMEPMLVEQRRERQAERRRKAAGATP